MQVSTKDSFTESRVASQGGQALNPQIERLLDLCGMNRKWIHGSGMELCDENGRKFLDFYSQYGALALGHNNPQVTGAVVETFNSMEPAMVQPYRAANAVKLAEELVRLVPGSAHCILTNSGAETVEAAIKLVRMKTGRPIILSCEGSYHGKTLGAVSISAVEHRAWVHHTSGDVAQIPFGDAVSLENFLKENAAQTAGFILEPIQGENGVIVPPEGYLTEVRKICSNYDVPLVLDEVQTGFGRTGHLFAHNLENIQPDVLLLSKALGGGIFPLGACIATADVWDPRFALVHSSTFANNNIASRVGLVLLEQITREGFIEDVHYKGDLLINCLRDIAERYPDIISEVRGRGLLCAIKLRPPENDSGYIRAYINSQGLYAYVIASILAELEGLLVLPTLNGRDIVRIAPPLIVSKEDIEKFSKGLERVCKLLREKPTELIGRMVVLRHTSQNAEKQAEEVRQKVRRNVNKPATLPIMSVPRSFIPDFAFIVHPTRVKDIVTNDPELGNLSESELNIYREYLADIPPGVVLDTPEIRAPDGRTVKGCLISLGLLPEEMFRFGRKFVSGEIAQAVDLAYELEARVVGLGAFTAGFTRHGQEVIGRGPAITTGNSLTATMAFAAIEKILLDRGIDIGKSVVGIVGAKGAVSSLCARLLARKSPAKIVLVSNPQSGVRSLQNIFRELEEYAPCEMSDDITCLKDCNIVISATSSPFPILDSVPLSPGTIVCDIARPPDSSEKLRSRNDITVIEGGLVALPDPSLKFGLGNIQGLPEGIQLACLSETILMALNGDKQNRSIGDTLSLEEADSIMELADRYGFKLSDRM